MSGRRAATSSTVEDGAATSNGASRPSRRVRVAAWALVALVALEGCARLAERRIPPPRLWVGPELPIKEDAIEQLSDSGGAAVVAVGSSTVDVALDPSEMTIEGLDRPIYNAATGAASLRIIDSWTRHVVVPRLRPDIVVIGMSARELNPNDPSQQELTQQWFDAPAVERALDEDSLLERAEWHLIHASALYRNRETMRSPADLWDVVRNRPIRSGAFGEVVADDGRYEAFDELSYRSMARLLRRHGLHEFRVGREEVALLGDLVADLEDEGIDVLLVSMPTSSEFLELLPGGVGTLDDVVDGFRSIAEDAGADFFDVGTFPDDLLADAGHTNAAGSERFTRLIEAEIATMAARRGPS